MNTKNLFKAFTLILGLVVLTYSCKKEKTPVVTPEPEPAEQQNVVNFYFNGSWNNVCGLFGKPVKDSLNEKFGNRNIMIHLGVKGGSTENDAFYNQQVDEFAQVLAPSTTIIPPIFFIGSDNLPFQKSNNPTSVLKDVTFGLFQTALAAKPKAGIMCFLNLEGSTLTVRTKSKFFVDIPQEHFVSAYLLEDGVAQTQADDKSKKIGIQDNVFRTKISNGVTGSLLGSQFKKGDIKELTLTKDIGTANAANKANLKVAIVLWYRTPGGSFYASNGYITKF